MVEERIDEVAAINISAHQLYQFAIKFYSTEKRRERRKSISYRNQTRFVSCVLIAENAHFHTHWAQPSAHFKGRFSSILQGTNYYLNNLYFYMLFIFLLTWTGYVLDFFFFFGVIWFHSGGSCAVCMWIDIYILTYCLSSSLVRASSSILYEHCKESAMSLRKSLLVVWRRWWCWVWVAF